MFWLIVDMASYSTNGDADKFFKKVSVFVIVIVLLFLLALMKNKPKTVFGYKLRNKDNYIEVRVGDAFNNRGALIVPINDHFDVSLGGNVKKAKSVLNKLISEYYAGKDQHLVKDISEKVKIGKAHDIGTTVEVEQKDKKFYLLVNSKKRRIIELNQQ
ncbi:MAG: macro domain-containing protein [Candidatus Omnitrophota bacterium]